MTERKISIVIPNLHSRVLGEVLAAVTTQTHDCADSIDVWIVGQDRFGYAQSNGQVHFIETPQPASPAQARNLGAVAAPGDMLIFLDADCVPQPGWLTMMTSALTRWPEAGAISGSMLPDGDSFGAHCAQVATFHEHLNLSRSGPRPTLASFSLLVPRDVWQTLHGFDEQFKFAAAEDLDFSVRVALQGRPLYFEPRAAVRHISQRRGWRSLWRHAFRSGSQSIIVRCRYADYYRTPAWMRSVWAWRILSPAIAVARSVQIYRINFSLLRYWRCAPSIVLSKLAWCWGAASGLEQLPITARHKGGA